MIIKIKKLIICLILLSFCIDTILWHKSVNYHSSIAPFIIILNRRIKDYKTNVFLFLTAILYPMIINIMLTIRLSKFTLTRNSQVHTKSFIFTLTLVLVFVLIVFINLAKTLIWLFLELDSSFKYSLFKSEYINLHGKCSILALLVSFSLKLPLVIHLLEFYQINYYSDKFISALKASKNLFILESIIAIQSFFLDIIFNNNFILNIEKIYFIEQLDGLYSPLSLIYILYAFIFLYYNLSQISEIY